MNLDELIESIYATGQEIKQYEQKYGLASADFYALYSQGFLDDGEYEETEDFSIWAGLYEIKLDREHEFQESSQARVRWLRQAANGNSLHLTPREELVEA